MLRALIGLAGQKHLNLSLPAAPGYQARVVERPGQWMPSGALAGLVDEMREVAARAAPAGALDYGVLSGRPEALERSILTLIRDRAGRLCAFNALAVLEIELGERPLQALHLGLVMVDPDHRAKGLSWALYGLTCFLLLVRGGLRPIWVSNVTQVPAVVGMVAESFGQVFPSPPLQGRAPSRRTLTHLLIARRILADHRGVFGVGPDADFDEDSFVIANAYTGGSEALKKRLSDCAPHRDPACVAFCAARLDYARGDDLLQIGVADLPNGFAYLRRSVPRRSLAGLLLAAAGIALHRVALPVVSWLDADRDLGILRPHKAAP